MRDTIGRSIAKALGGYKIGDGWLVRCPAHHDRKPSLSISLSAGGKLLVRCDAGCNQERSLQFGGLVVCGPRPATAPSCL